MDYSYILLTTRVGGIHGRLCWRGFSHTSWSTQPRGSPTRGRVLPLPQPHTTHNQPQGTGLPTAMQRQEGAVYAQGYYLSNWNTGSCKAKSEFCDGSFYKLTLGTSWWSKRDRIWEGDRNRRRRPGTWQTDVPGLSAALMTHLCRLSAGKLLEEAQSLLEKIRTTYSVRVRKQLLQDRAERKPKWMLDFKGPCVLIDWTYN